MNRLAIVLVLVTACGGKKSDDKGQPAAKKAADTTTCPMPKGADVTEAICGRRDARLPRQLDGRRGGEVS